MIDGKELIKKLYEELKKDADGIKIVYDRFDEPVRVVIIEDRDFHRESKGYSIHKDYLCFVGKKEKLCLSYGETSGGYPSRLYEGGRMIALILDKNEKDIRSKIFEETQWLKNTFLLGYYNGEVFVLNEEMNPKIREREGELETVKNVLKDYEIEKPKYKENLFVPSTFGLRKFVDKTAKYDERSLKILKRLIVEIAKSVVL